MSEVKINDGTTMKDLLGIYPGAQRALFRKYHIGGCSSCGFQPTETLAQLCERNNNLKVQEVIDYILMSHEEDQSILISPKDLENLIQTKKVKILDIRTREEWDALRIEGATFFTEETMQEILGRWPKDQVFVIYDHLGTRSLDAAAYFVGHGFQHARALRGGIDAWAAEVDSDMARYEVEKT
jgi:rhodanese-related sulfurtransferase